MSRPATAISLLLPKAHARDSEQRKFVRRILIRLEACTRAVDVLRTACETGVLSHAECTLFQVLTPTVFGELQEDERFHHAERMAAESWLQRAAARHLGGLSVTTLVDRDVSPCRSILRHSAGFDLLVLGTHAHGRIGRILAGSVAEKVLRETPLPVLLIKIDDANRGRRGGNG